MKVYNIKRLFILLINLMIWYMLIINRCLIIPLRCYVRSGYIFLDIYYLSKHTAL